MKKWYAEGARKGMQAEYKAAKEAFVSGTRGGSVSRINAVCLTALVRSVLALRRTLS